MRTASAKINLPALRLPCVKRGTAPAILSPVNATTATETLAGEQNASPLHRELFAAGYVQSPNNIYHLAGSIWYAGAGGIPQPAKMQEVQVDIDRIRVFSTKFFGEPYTRTSFWDTVTVAVFADVPSFLAWCEENGELSLPGLPAGIWGD